jgi:hypothetical protein
MATAFRVVGSPDEINSAISLISVTGNYTYGDGVGSNYFCVHRYTLVYTVVHLSWRLFVNLLYIYAYIYLYLCTCTSIFMYICIYTYMYIYIYIYIYTYIYIYINIYICIIHMYIFIYSFIYRY